MAVIERLVLCGGIFIILVCCGVRADVSLNSWFWDILSVQTDATENGDSSSASGAIMSMSASFTTGEAGTGHQHEAGVNRYGTLTVNGVLYSQQGLASMEVPEGYPGAQSERQAVFAPQTIGALSVQRKFYVPFYHGTFCRWLNSITNTSPVSQNAVVTLTGNLPTGTRTTVRSTSDVPLDQVSVQDRWIIMGGSSCHILRGDGARVYPAHVNFQDGIDEVQWDYEVTLAAGETITIMNVLACFSNPNVLIQDLEWLTAGMSDEEKSRVVNFDLFAPTVTVDSPTSESTTSTAIPVTLTFSEPVTGFDQSDLVATNAWVEGFSYADNTCSFTLASWHDGTVTLNIAEGAARDNGKHATPAVHFQRIVDTVQPVLELKSSTPNPSYGAAVIHMQASFSEPVIGFDASDVTLTRGALASADSFSGSGSDYVFDIVPTIQSGSVVVSVAPGVCADAAGNASNGAVLMHRVASPTGPSCTALDSSKSVPVKASLLSMSPLFLAAVGLLAVQQRSRRK